MSYYSHLKSHFLGNIWEKRSINDEMALISIAGIGESEKEQFLEFQGEITF